MIWSSKDVWVLGIDADASTCLQKHLQAGFRVWRKDEGLHAATLSLDPSTRKMGEDHPLKGRECGLEWGESLRCSWRHRDRALGCDAGLVLRDGEFGDFAFTPAVEEDEKSQAGVTQESPCLGRLGQTRE